MLLDGSYALEIEKTMEKIKLIRRYKLKNKEIEVLFYIIIGILNALSKLLNFFIS